MSAFDWFIYFFSNINLPACNYFGESFPVFAYSKFVLVKVAANLKLVLFEVLNPTLNASSKSKIKLSI